MPTRGIVYARTGTKKSSSATATAIFSTATAQAAGAIGPPARARAIAGRVGARIVTVIVVGYRSILPTISATSAGHQQRCVGWSDHESSPTPTADLVAKESSAVTDSTLSAHQKIQGNPRIKQETPAKHSPTTTVSSPTLGAISCDFIGSTQRHRPRGDGARVFEGSGAVAVRGLQGRHQATGKAGGKKKERMTLQGCVFPSRDRGRLD
jgi:hypothetical protein